MESSSQVQLEEESKGKSAYQDGLLNFSIN